MNNLALIESFSNFKNDKNIDRATLIAILEEVFRGVLVKKYGSDKNFDIIVNPDKGDLEIWRNRRIVDDGEVYDENEEIELSEARKIEDDFEIGEEVSEEVTLEELGRRVILSIKQSLLGKIQEYHNTELYKQFKDREGTIVTAEVHYIIGGAKAAILFDDNQNEMILPKSEQIQSDFFRKGDTIRAVIKQVEFKNGKSVIVLSRTDERFLERLFENEIPEISDGLITIKNTVRIPGEKAKIAVETYDDRIDPVGACVGMRGSRIHGIVRELGNENIDVVNYTENTQLYISRALNPAKIKSMEIDDENKTVKIILDSQEISKAIGRFGHNVKLAGMLTGYEIDVYRDSNDLEEDIELSEFSDEVEGWILEAFRNIGCDTAKSVLELSKNELVKRTDLEEETIEEVYQILNSEFEK